MRTQLTDDQVKFLRQNFKLDRKELTRLFNKKFKQNKSVVSIYSWLRRHGFAIKTNHYSDEQIDFLRDNNQINPFKLTRLFNKKFGVSRSVESVFSFLQRQGFVVKKSGYTDEQIDFLHDNYELQASELTRLFNKKFKEEKSIQSLKAQKKKYGLTNKHYMFTEKQTEFLKANINLDRSVLTKLYNKEFKQNKSVNSITCMLSKRGLLKRKSYTDEQVEFLKTNSWMEVKRLTKLFNETFKEKKSVIAIKAQLFCRGLR
ncbi:MAG: hypothetical protein LBD41_03945 [Clostridiales Family XIII bacterium]|jgi:hypothetical protein|nr:hypothetical protein [Clostridiales Family XIII bacterium]